MSNFTLKIISVHIFAFKTKRTEQKSRNREEGRRGRKKEERKNAQLSKILYFCF